MSIKNKELAVVQLYDRGYSPETLAKVLELKIENVNNAIKKIKGIYRIKG